MALSPKATGVLPAFLSGLLVVACGGDQAAAPTEATVAAAPAAAPVAASPAAFHPNPQEGAAAPHAALSSTALYEIALRHLRAGDAEAAVHHLDLAIAEDPTDPSLYDARSTAHLQLEQLTEALADIEKAVDLEPDEPGLLSNRGQLYRRFGREKEGRRDFDRALELDPGYVPALFNRGTQSFNQGDSAAALADFDAALAVSPEMANLHFNRAMALEALGRMPEAVAAMQRFTDLASAEYRPLGEEILHRWDAAAEKQAQTEALDELLDKAQVELDVPEGFRLEAGADNEAFAYEATLLRDAGGLEIRLAIRPIRQMEIEYHDPHAASPEPEHLYPLLFQGITTAIASDPYASGREFGATALGEYHADWGQLIALTPLPAYAPQKHMLFLALHKAGAADLYLSFLYDDYLSVKEDIDRALHVLRFRETPSSNP